MEERKRIIKYTPTQAKLKLEQWCAYQERSHKDVSDKLYSLGLYSNDVNSIISYLIENNFLNEERFAEAYVSGKFKIKGWGRVKIVNGLKLKRVSPANIKHGLKQIDADDYWNKLQSIAIKKNKLIKEKHPLKRKQKLVSYLAAKGYESDLVFETANKILKGEE